MKYRLKSVTLTRRTTIAAGRILHSAPASRGGEEQCIRCLGICASRLRGVGGGLTGVSCFVSRTTIVAMFLVVGIGKYLAALLQTA